MVKAVIFDFDDTLSVTIKIRWEAIKHCGKEKFGIDITDETIKSLWGIKYDDLIDQLFPLSGYTLEQKKQMYKETVKQFPLRLQDGALKALAYLKEQGYLLGVLSSFTKDMGIPELTRLGLGDDMFVKTQFAEDTLVHKPNPEVFNPTLQLFSERDIKPSECLYVGDAVYDGVAARGAGINFIGVTTGLHSESDFKVEGFTSISSLSELTHRGNIEKLAF